MRMQSFILFLVVMVAVGVPSAVHGNIGPRPPITRQEVGDPENWLRMESEVVDVSVDSERAHVVAKFHFVPVKRNDFIILTLRMGFPELAADAPLENFHVQQWVDAGQSAAPPAQVAQFTLGPSPAADAWSKTLGVKRWFSWPLELPAAMRYTSVKSVDVEVSYDQKLRGTGTVRQTTYVLRTGAPWAGTVASSIVNVRLQPGARLVKSTPKNDRANDRGVTYTFTDWEPDTDVTFWVTRK